MVWFLRKCEKCSKYTLKKDNCLYCGAKIRIPHPAKFSPDDKYLKYRLALKMETSRNERNFHKSS